MNGNEEFRDLAPLSPKADPKRWERMTAAIEAAAVPELARRRSIGTPSITMLLNQWLRPAVSTAFAIATVSALYLAVAPGGTAGDSLTPGISDDLGYSQPLAAWIEADLTPSVEELLLTMDTP